MKPSYELERKLRKFTVNGLMNYIVGGMALVFVLDLMLPSVNLYGMLLLSRAQVMNGQIWRLITFAFLPPNTSLLWIVFSLYLYWLIGSVLESQWGAFKFNLFYWVGMLGNILAALITGYATNLYLNLSLYLAFAALNPNFQLTLFFILPIKIKYLALLEVVGYAYMFIVGDWSTKVMILFSLLNLILFLGGDMLMTLRRESHYWKTRYNFRKAMRK